MRIVSFRCSFDVRVKEQPLGRALIHLVRDGDFIDTRFMPAARQDDMTPARQAALSGETDRTYARLDGVLAGDLKDGLPQLGSFCKITPSQLLYSHFVDLAIP